MKHLSISFCIIGFLLCHAGNAAAQGAHRYEAFGSVGVSFYDEIFGGSGTTSNLGAGFGIRPVSESHRIAHRFGLEFEFDTETETTFTGGFFSRAVPVGHRRQNLYLGDVLYHFGDGRIEPYVLASYGRASSPNSSKAGGFGGGVKIYNSKHVLLRPEIRLADTEHANFSIRGSFGVGYHW